MVSRNLNLKNLSFESGGGGGEVGGRGGERGNGWVTSTTY